VSRRRAGARAQWGSVVHRVAFFLQYAMYVYVYIMNLAGCTHVAIRHQAVDCSVRRAAQRTRRSGMCRPRPFSSSIFLALAPVLRSLMLHLTDGRAAVSFSLNEQC
jgi:hypothetical protein